MVCGVENDSGASLSLLRCDVKGRITERLPMRYPTLSDRAVAARLWQRECHLLADYGRRAVFQQVAGTAGVYFRA